jgi:prevent-host-death family protein
MSSKQVGIEDARKALGPLVDEACNGTDIVLTRRGQPIARIVPIEERHMPTAADWIATFRTFSIVPTVVDTLGIENRSPGLMDLGRAQLALEAAPFAALVAAIDEFFGDELDAALAGPESAAAEAEARRLVAEHLAAATRRLAVGVAILPQTDWATATSMTLQNLAHVALQRAADQRFVEVVSPAVKVPA